MDDGDSMYLMLLNRILKKIVDKSVVYFIIIKNNLKKRKSNT